MQIKIAARSSLLSKAQVCELEKELAAIYQEVSFSHLFVQTKGDKDLNTSLLTQEKTDFFTKEVDDLVLASFADVSVHSAKDLPEILPEGLEIFALTKGVDPRDSLVLKENKALLDLGHNPKIGTSSFRRMEMIRKILPNAQMVDIRGTIDRRLLLLQEGAVDALIIAEAALIRLNLTHLNRIILEEKTAPMQGRLAVVGKKDDFFLKQIFSSVDCQGALI